MDWHYWMSELSEQQGKVSLESFLGPGRPVLFTVAGDFVPSKRTAAGLVTRVDTTVGLSRVVEMLWKLRLEKGFLEGVELARTRVEARRTRLDSSARLRAFLAEWFSATDQYVLVYSEACEVLPELTRREVIAVKDVDGSVLHIAVLETQHQRVRCIIEDYATWIAGSESLV